MITPSRGKARIGILVPFTNTNLEADMALLRPDGVSVHFARLGGYDIDEIPDASQMAGLGAADIDEPLRMLSGVKPDVIMYGCTSATLTHGPSFDRELATKIKTSSGAATVTAAGALVNALKTLNITRIGFASPYVSDINQQAVSFLANCGFKSISQAEVTETLDNYGQGELGPDKIFELGLNADSIDAEAIVLSCTDMRSVEVIDRLEQRLGKPVITSNQAMVFEALQLLKIGKFQTGYGCLFGRLKG